MIIVRLIPDKNSKYHFGEGNLFETSLIFHSNSLFSTIINNLGMLYGNRFIENNINELKNIKISSLFPAIYQFKKEDVKNEEDIENEILFIPKPMIRLGFDKDTQKEIENEPKTIKKIKFISLESLKLHNKKKLKKIVLDKNYLITEKERNDFNYKNPQNIKLFSRILEQKVTIDRIKNTTLDIDGTGQLYSVEYIKPLGKKDKKTKMENKVGFYFILDFNGLEDENIKKKILSAINFIKDEGIGGKRRIGYGNFKNIIIGNKYKNTNLEDVFKNKGDLNYTSLSITLPKDKKEFESFETYGLSKIGGYIYTTTKIQKIGDKLKNTVYAISEGSVCNRRIEGKICSLKPKNAPHDIILNGKPVLLPIKVFNEW